MKLLFENWRQYLNEGIHPKIQEQINDLPDWVHIGIDVWGMHVSIFYTNKEGKSFAKSLGQVLMIQNYEQRYGNCLNGEEKQVFSIHETSAEKGLGPLLYEIAIEWASANGKGLMPGRYIVSGDALGVWEKYTTRSNDDVKKDQLDIDKGISYFNPKGYDQLTPEDPNDDCHQKSAIASKSEKWYESPLSKIYSKNNTEVMDYFQGMKRLKVTTS
jgi:GNAT superfamily N-acetyltransferase